MTNSELLKAIDSVVQNLQGLSDAEIKRKYDETQSNLIENTIESAHEFLLYQSSLFEGQFKLNTHRDQKYIMAILKDIVNDQLIEQCNRAIFNAANDNNYLMAA